MTNDELGVTVRKALLDSPEESCALKYMRDEVIEFCNTTDDDSFAQFLFQADFGRFCLTRIAERPF